MSKWILANPQVFHNRIIHEVGAGIGLPLLYASFFAKRAIFSDYLTSLIDNFNFNVQSNIRSMETSTLCESYVGQLQSLNDDSINLNDEIFQRWNLITQNQKSIEKQIMDEEACIVSQQPHIDYPMIDLHQVFVNYRQDNCDNNKKNNNSTDINFTPYLPPTDYLTWDSKTHFKELLHHRQNCYNNMRLSTIGLLLDWQQYQQFPQFYKDQLKCEIILGSEVSYPTILDTLPSLVLILNETLCQENGVFYLIQSPNRGTSIYFIEELCGKHNFLLDMRIVDCDVELADFDSGQRRESYVYYTFRRQTSKFPIMGIQNDLIQPPIGLTETALKNINTNTMKQIIDENTHEISFIESNEIVFEMKLAVAVTDIVDDTKLELTITETTTSGEVQ